MKTTLCLVLLLLAVASAHTQDNPAGAGLDASQFRLTRIGKIKARSAREIPSSILWIGGEVLDRDYAVYENYKKYLGPLGAKKIRLQSGWAKTEKEKGQYDFAWLDKVVADALAQGVQPWIQTSYGNPLYEGAGGSGLGEGLITSDEAFVAWENYVAALVERYKDRVTEWEIWNEADLKKNNATEGAYTKLFLHTAPVIRKVQPNAFIVALALSRVGDTNLATSFLDGLRDSNQLGLVNAVSIHGYPKNPDATLKDIKEYQSLLKKYSSNLELWQGESGCPSTKGSSGALSGHPWTEATQAKWNTRRALLHIGNRVPFSLFTISEFSYVKTGLNTKGILKLHQDLTVASVKPAYHAYQHLTSTFDSSLEPVAYEIVEGPDVTESYTVATFRHGVTKKVIKAVWFSNDIPADRDDFRAVPIFFGQDDFEQLVYAHVVNGDVYSVGRDAVEAQDDKLTVKVPVYDAPILVGDKSLINVDPAKAGR